MIDKITNVLEKKQQLFSLLLLLFVLFFFISEKEGDSSIYFVFYKNFYNLPFSFQPGTVSFGATSPLQVFVFAPVFHLFIKNWIFATKLLNFFFVFIGIIYLNKAINKGAFTFFLITFFTIINVPLMISVSRLFETGLLYLLISMLYYYVVSNNNSKALIVSGLMHLIRPELVVLTVIFDLLLIIKSKDRKRAAMIIFLSLIPLFAYYTYMFAKTGSLIPSSVYGRLILATESNLSWKDSFSETLGGLYLKSLCKENILYYLGFATLFFSLFSKRLFYLEKILFIFPVITVFIIFPPGSYILRYLLPITPILALTICEVLSNVKFKYNVLLILIISLIMWHFMSTTYTKNKLDYDTLLLKDLASQLNPIIKPGEKILTYEIQGQFYLDSFCYSLDGIVGDQFIDVLSGKEKIEDFILKNNVKYIITMNSFNYRKLYNNTALLTLYMHDLDSKVGDKTKINNLFFEKVLTNESFANPKLYQETTSNNLNYGNTFRVYNKSNPNWVGSSFAWNSVYKIIN